jgi:uncharacterized SAM-binding protein YcdF (DUF218 family)
VQLHTIWFPTWLGWLCLGLFLAIPLLWWWIYGEAFLSMTERLPGEILVVEGWIGRDGVRAAGAEFEQHGYLYVVTTGGLTSGDGWEEPGWSFAEGAEHELIRDGVAKDRIIVAAARDVERNRTYESAVAVWRALRARGIEPKTINVFTLGPHARRSRLVFAKVYGPKTEVGVISWVPAGHQVLPWWRSSQRSREMITETTGYLFETLLNSGRSSNSPDTASSLTK